MTDRDRLIVEYLPWAIAVARRRRRRHPVIEADEMVGEAMIALVEGIDRFDPARGLSLKTFLACRVNFAISDRIKRDTRANRDRQSTTVAPAQEAYAQLREVARRLPPRWFQAITEHAEGNSFAAIGASLGVSQMRAWQLLDQARRRLAAA